MAAPPMNQHERRRVLHIVQNLNYGGMERLIAEIVSRTDNDSFESHVLALQYLGRFAMDVPAGTGLHTAPRMSRWSNLRPVALAEIIRRIAPGVVHTHSGVWYKGGLAARLAGVRRLIHTEHGRSHPDPFTDRFIGNQAARRTDVVVAVSEPLREYLQERVLPRGSSVCVIRNGVDTARIRPMPDDLCLRGELGLDPKRPIIGSIGRLEDVKGFDVMIRAFALLQSGWNRAEPPPALVIAGDGSQKDFLQRLALELDVSSNVFLLGWRDDVSTLHRCFRIFSLSSHSEGTSVSLIEAMSAGICPIVTDVGGNADVLGEGLTHRLVEPGDPSALAKAWQHAFNSDVHVLEVDADKARQRAETAFGVEAMVRAYESLYV